MVCSGVNLLEGKNILITGVANRWSIATGIAHQMHRNGARLAFIYQGDRVKGEAEKLAAELGGGPVIECDVSSDQALHNLNERLAKEFGRLDGLVHSIAFANKEDLMGKVYDTSRAGFQTALDVSAYSLIALVQALRETFNDRASVVALTYLGATAIVPNYNLMGIAKAALEASVRYLAFDLGERGIRVNAISAGPIKTASARQVKGLSLMLEKVSQAAPLRRNVSQDDVGKTAVYLMSDLSEAITGDIHFVDAGYHAMGMYPEKSDALDA
ncbi:MAG: enoyl-ACP reductase [Candidatus Eremiobacteraeota bacterium]|nr:enoyl-ACP reductase [Candidatus Eremiobacteraeota bacterium]